MGEWGADEEDFAVADVVRLAIRKLFLAGRFLDDGGRDDMISKNRRAKSDGAKNAPNPRRRASVPLLPRFDIPVRHPPMRSGGVRTGFSWFGEFGFRPFSCWRLSLRAFALSSPCRATSSPVARRWRGGLGAGLVRYRADRRQ